MPSNANNCKEKAKALAINDPNVLGKPSENQVCGCRAFAHRGALALHWNDPNRLCSPSTKCTNKSHCVCLSNGKNKIYKIWFYHPFF